MQTKIMYDGGQLLLFGAVTGLVGFVLGKFAKRPTFKHWDTCHICSHRYCRDEHPECPRCGCPIEDTNGS